MNETTRLMHIFNLKSLKGVLLTTIFILKRPKKHSYVIIALHVDDLILTSN
jgi:hypothetical protein